MNKVLEFVTKHIVASVAILVGAVAVVTTASSFIASKVQYDAYVKEYEKDKAEKDKILPRLPKSIILDNDYISYDDSACSVDSSKSKYNTPYVYQARDAVVVPNDNAAPQKYETIGDSSWETITGLGRKGGTITFEFNVDDYGFSDIDLVMASNWTNKAGELQTIENVSDYIKIEVNGLSITTEGFELPSDGSYQHLILKDAYLLMGKNTVKIKTAVYNTEGGNDLYVMPDVRNLTVITDLNISSIVTEE